jgi:hypothetical protein
MVKIITLQTKQFYNIGLISLLCLRCWLAKWRVDDMMGHQIQLQMFSCATLERINVMILFTAVIYEFFK